MESRAKRSREVLPGHPISISPASTALLITGEVPSEEAKAAIGEQAARVADVKEVINEARSARSPRSSVRSNDSYITSKVKGRLVDEKYLSAIHVKVVTESGVTYLMGIVTEREAKLAVTIARTTDGVRKVVNRHGGAQRRRDQSPRHAARRRQAGRQQPAPVESR